MATTIYKSSQLSPLLALHYDSDRDAAQGLFSTKPNSALAAQVKRENPQEYYRIRGIAEKLGLRSRPTGPALQLRSDRAYTPAEMEQIQRSRHHEFTQEELKARSLNDENQCREIFCKPGNTAEKLKRDNPEAYRLAKLAAISYGMLSQSSTESKPQDTAYRRGIGELPRTEGGKFVAEEKEEKLPADKMRVSDAYAKHFNLKPGTIVSLDENAAMSAQYYDNLITRVNELAAKHGADPQPVRQALAEVKAEAVSASQS